MSPLPNQISIKDISRRTILRNYLMIKSKIFVNEYDFDLPRIAPNINNRLNCASSVHII